LGRRRGGLGEQAIEAGKPIFIHYGKRTSKKFNPAVYDAGIKSYAAFPLIFRGRKLPLEITNLSSQSDDPLTGVLYIAFKQPRRFTKGETNSLKLFISLAIDAIRNVTYHAQALHSSRQLAHLDDIARLFAGEADPQHLLHSIAGHTQNILAADLVMIYVYDAGEHRFLSIPATAGKRQNPISGPGGLGSNYTPPLRLVTERESIYAQSPEQTIALYSDKEHQDMVIRFVEEEEIQSVAAVLLRLGEEVIGGLFVNYRHIHAFSSYERRFIETLASTAAIALWNRRLEITAPQIRAKAIKEICGALLHEFAPRIGALELHATEEVPNYKTSSVKVRLDRCKGPISAIRGLRRAAEGMPTRGVFDLVELVRDIVDEEAQGKGLDISLRGSAPMLTQADRGLLELAICNGLRNAIEAVSDLPKDGRRREVIIDWGVTGNMIWLRIIDNGMGLHTKTPFKLGTSTKKGHSGFGLVTAQLAMASMGGDTRLTPGEDGGALFEIRWDW
jgi:GAF domain-containing protein